MSATLKEARKRARLTQDELAAKSGVDQTTISSLETGRIKQPTDDTRVRLAKALRIAPSRLRFSEPDPDPVSVAATSDGAGHDARRTA